MQPRGRTEREQPERSIVRVSRREPLKKGQRNTTLEDDSVSREVEDTGAPEQ
jgi:hypothetical protein